MYSWLMKGCVHAIASIQTGAVAYPVLQGSDGHCQWMSNASTTDVAAGLTWQYTALANRLLTVSLRLKMTADA